ncbi:TasA family protein [Haloarculaceae archaeon H-GB2-1]|nr:TasA family protein [Haloarculaceae archaeon H-GB1-1]MEA5407898.1 TasA family protein [Haloarculaceae archaeon H-GB2-1]
MTREGVTITRRGLLAAVATVGTASAGAGAGTFALFSDEETSSGNTLQAGTLDLHLDGGNQNVTLLDEGAMQPGESAQSSVQLANTGSLSAKPLVEVTAVQSTENGFYGKEQGQDPSGTDGELDEHLEVRATIGSTTVWSRQTVANLTTGTPYDPGTTLGSGGSKQFTLEWWLPADTSELAQSDGVELDLAFRLEQT